LGLAGCGADSQVAPPTQALGIVDGQWAQVSARPEVAPAVPKQVKSVSVPIDGAIGGVVELGHSSLTIPPGAFEGTQTITMECDNAAGKECRLYPDGLRFSQPVQLTMKLKGAPIDGPDATIFWWDPTAGAWVDIMGTYDPKGHTVTANLQHFSLYSPGRGRAGW
jgi:hypothetical protein